MFDESSAYVVTLVPLLMVGLVVGGLLAFSHRYRRAGSVVVTLSAVLLGGTFVLAFVL